MWLTDKLETMEVPQIGIVGPANTKSHQQMYGLRCSPRAGRFVFFCCSVFLYLWIILNVLHNHTFKFVPFGISKAACRGRGALIRLLCSPKSRRLQHTFTFIGRLKSTHNTHRNRSHNRLIMIDY